MSNFKGICQIWEDIARPNFMENFDFVHFALNFCSLYTDSILYQPGNYQIPL